MAQTMVRKIIHFGCVVCNEDNAFSELISCGGCSLEFHQNCLNLSQISDSVAWRCTQCVESPPPLKKRVKVQRFESAHSAKHLKKEEIGEYEQAAVNLLSLLSDRPRTDEVNAQITSRDPVAVKHRVSCHRCGNLRKNNVICEKCPHIFCRKLFAFQSKVVLTLLTDVLRRCELSTGHLYLSKVALCAKRFAAVGARELLCALECTIATRSVLQPRLTPRSLTSGLIFHLSFFLLIESIINQYHPVSSEQRHYGWIKFNLITFF